MRVIFVQIEFGKVLVFISILHPILKKNLKIYKIVCISIVYMFIYIYIKLNSTSIKHIEN